MYSVNGDVLQPMLSFANPVDVSLEHPVGFDLDDATILQMARSWPRLASLFLEARPLHHIHPRVTLEGVYFLAENCHSLRRLGMTVDVTSVPNIRLDKERRRAAQKRLFTFDVSLSPVTNPGRVAVFLAAIFPELRRIMTFYDNRLYLDDDEHEIGRADVLELHSRWKAVEDVLR
ncbi:hypothetical protein B0H17DRAFT_1143877 [Mycena rosella]|uniref:Uncharacterized protein n=1 Tax=Mycena rosella TaxID=1033263 RepID=A0AAD7CU69_MYCRO|nr:hypothetical protein B0H17DRAFT_1143877 [Mycena rosella]